MSKFSNFIGIDVAKDKVDVFSTETSTWVTVPNSAAEIRKAFRKVDPTAALVVVESTGGYERICIKTLAAMNFAIHRANNNRVKSFIESEGIADKTDKIDARCLAFFGCEKQHKVEIHTPATELQEEIRQSALRLTSLKRMKVQEKNKLQSPGCDLVADSCREMIDFLDGQIAALKKRLLELIGSDAEMRKNFELLRQYKGIGETSALYLLSCLPELGKIKPKALFALAGLAPRANDSGKYHGYRTTKGRGRPFVKQLMFMVALSAVRFNENIAALYEKKIAEHKRKMVAIVACMRKIISQLNAILRKGEMTF
jgi:transposase